MMMMNAQRSRRQKKISKKQENAVAKELGGKTQAASGAVKLGGGADVRVRHYSADGLMTNSFRIECKYTEKSAYSLKKADLRKLVIQASRTFEQPVMQVAFVDTLGRRDEFAIIKTTWGNTSIIDAKSVNLIKDQLDQILLTHKEYRIRFAGEPEGWAIKHWSEFIKEVHIDND